MPGNDVACGGGMTGTGVPVAGGAGPARDGGVGRETAGGTLVRRADPNAMTAAVAEATAETEASSGEPVAAAPRASRRPTIAAIARTIRVVRSSGGVEIPPSVRVYARRPSAHCDEGHFSMRSKSRSHAVPTPFIGRLTTSTLPSKASTVASSDSMTLLKPRESSGGKVSRASA